MSIIGSNILAGASGQGGGYTIERSVRLRSSASAYFNRTPASAGNRKTWTWSGWVKRGNLGATQYIASAYYATSSGRYNLIRFDSTNALNVWTNAYNISSSATQQNTTSAVFRDVGAWYHIVVSLDTTQATASDRLKIYVNGVSQSYTGNTISLNQDTFWNGTDATHRIGEFSSSYLDGYLTEINFIDGQALTPDSFGEYDSITGVWKPAKYTGTYGTNGFYLDFNDNTTTTTLAADGSGNGNNWTPNNISLTSGVTYDSMTDTPTIYAGGGNYATLNPLVPSWSASLSNYSNANLAIYGGGTQRAIGTQQIPSTGKWYFEFQDISYGNGGSAGVGVVTSSTDPTVTTACNYQSDGTKYVNGSTTSYGSTYGSTSSNTDVVGVAVDNDVGTVTFYKNNTSQGAITHGIGNVLYPAIIKAGVNAGVIYANFGQRPFAYTPPDGFLSLHTGNLPEPEIVDGGEYFNTVLWTGDNTTSRTISGVGFQPDFTWIKSRSIAGSHNLVNAIVGSEYRLRSNSTATENFQSENGYVSAFTSDGFTVAKGSSTHPTYTGWYETNQTSQTYAAWNWKANGAGVSNTDGSITSTVSANPTAGFSIVTYTGGGAGSTIGHGLAVAPKMIIVKDRVNAGSDWCVYTSTTGAGAFLKLNTTAASAADTTMWGNTSPTSSVFTWGYGSGVNYVAYCFSEVEGYSKFGSYTGNGSTDGTFVFTGFRPAFILVKSSSNTFDWHITDTSRSPYNQADTVLFPNLSAAETNGGGYYYDLTSNGFKCRNLGAATNGNGYTYIYMAFAEVPFKFALGR